MGAVFAGCCAYRGSESGLRPEPAKADEEQTENSARSVPISPCTSAGESTMMAAGGQTSTMSAVAAFRATLAKTVPTFAALCSGAVISPAMAGPEPEVEPEVHGEHHEFVMSLRETRASESDPEFWQLSDFDHEAYRQCRKCEAIERSVVELRAYFADWQSSGHDVFWHRKSHQVVLAVVVCRLADGSVLCYRGMNTEVSLPAGSLCAERAGIARAASELRAASEIVSVAVLDPSDKINPLWPCEVCQSWLAKLRDQNAAIAVVAVRDSGCVDFVVRVNGELQPRPRAPVQPPAAELVQRVRLAEGVRQQPWEAKEVVYVDGSWDGAFEERSSLLQTARGEWSKDVYVMAGIFSDDTLRNRGALPAAPKMEYTRRIARLLEDRHVSAVLVDAPWDVKEEMLSSFGIRRVVVESATTERRRRLEQGAYEVAEKRSVLVRLPDAAFGGV
mmetsp:Transcript_45757/g.119021  ORF Transcript_45757/g.119021 Transcript_45757/m.119021 type:complete len:447 (-) Transcript_45757:15-1355(-)